MTSGGQTFRSVGHGVASSLGGTDTFTRCGRSPDRATPRDRRSPQHAKRQPAGKSYTDAGDLRSGVSAGSGNRTNQGNELPVGRPFQADIDGPRRPSYTRAGRVAIPTCRVRPKPRDGMPHSCYPPDRVLPSVRQLGTLLLH